MAKLGTSDPQYGVSVASRINKELAYRLNKEAKQNGVSLSFYLADIIHQSRENKNKAIELTNLLAKEKERLQTLEQEKRKSENKAAKDLEIYRTAIGSFITEISKGKKDKTMYLIDRFNKILNDEKCK